MLRLLPRPTIKTVKISLLSTAMSLCPKQVLSGTRWDYSIVGPLQGDGTHQSTVYKAEVVPRCRTADIPKWALIKSAAPGNPIAKENLKREWEAYQRPSVTTSPAFRKMYDLIGDPSGFEGHSESGTRTTLPFLILEAPGGPQELEVPDSGTCTPSPYLALEWLDHTLADVETTLDRRGYILVTTVIETVMSSLVSLEQAGLVNTDTKPANILIQGAGTDHPIVKVADLGLTFPPKTRLKAQPHAMRAPEVYIGQPCTTPSQMWSCAALLLVWLQPGILGPYGNTGGELLRNSWCMAKLKRLFPAWRYDLPVVDDDAVLRAEVQVIGMFLEELEEGNGEAHPILRNILPLEAEMERMGLMAELRDLLRFMFVVDPEARPTASQVLASRELRALKDAVAGLE